MLSAVLLNASFPSVAMVNVVAPEKVIILAEEILIS